MRRSVVMFALVACGKGDAPKPAPAAQGSSAPTCEPLAFEPSTPLPEASGATWFNGQIIAVGDSGQRGAYAIIDPATGKTVEQGKLPLGDPPNASDDLEGLATQGGQLVGIASAGWIRVWTRTDKGFDLVQGPYALGPVDLPNNKGIGDKPPKGDGMVCPIEGTNCGRNYEGICLGTTGGYVLSKADGHLYPVTLDNKQLVVHREGAIEAGRPGVVADCSIDGSDVWVGNNLFGMNDVRRVSPGALDLGNLGAGFAEVLVVHGDTVVRMSDTGGAPSLMGKFRCAAIAR